MLPKNWYNNDVKVDKVITPILSSSTTDVTGASVDALGFGSVVLLGFIGVTLDTLSGSVKVELELQESDDNSTFTACADADLENPNTGAAGHVSGTNTGTFAVIDDNAEDDALFAVRYVGSKRYVRVVANKTGTHTNGIPISAIALRGRSDIAPAA